MIEYAIVKKEQVEQANITTVQPFQTLAAATKHKAACGGDIFHEQGKAIWYVIKPAPTGTATLVGYTEDK